MARSFVDFLDMSLIMLGADGELPKFCITETGSTSWAHHWLATCKDTGGNLEFGTLNGTRVWTYQFMKCSLTSVPKLKRGQQHAICACGDRPAHTSLFRCKADFEDISYPLRQISL